MEDQEILNHIEQLVQEEHDLRKGLAAGQLHEDARKALADLQVRRAQYWDLLRQRHGRRDAGLNPDDAMLRSAEVVEKYTR